MEGGGEVSDTPRTDAAERFLPLSKMPMVARCNMAALEADYTTLRAHAERLAEALKDITETLEAHEVDTLDCDRAGNKFCTCLERRISKADKALTLYRAENPKV